MQCAKVKSQLGEWEKDVAAFGATITSDGWRSAARRDYVNVMVTTNKGAYFHSSIDTSDMDAPQVKDAAYVASIIIQAIKDIGPDNVVSIITDRASVMKADWTIIEQEFPYIVCVWCAAHVLDLLGGYWQDGIFHPRTAARPGRRQVHQEPSVDSQAIPLQKVTFCFASLFFCTQ
jgi:hypothetical protein